MGAAESKHVQQEAKVGSSLPDSVPSHEASQRLIPAVSDKKAFQSAEGLKRRLDGSLSPARGVKKRRLSNEADSTRQLPERIDSPTPGWSASFPGPSRQNCDETVASPANFSIANGKDGDSPSCELDARQQDDQDHLQDATRQNAQNETSVPPSLPTSHENAFIHSGDNGDVSSGQSGIAAVPDLDSQLAGVSTELREALVLLTAPTEESMPGWKNVATDSIPDAQRESNQVIVRRAIESLREVQHTPTFSAASLQQSTTTVEDFAITGQDRFSSEEVESSFLRPVEEPIPEDGAGRLGHGEVSRLGKRRRVDDGGGRRKHKRRRRNTNADQYPVLPLARLRKLVDLWRKEGQWTVLRCSESQ